MGGGALYDHSALAWGQIRIQKVQILCAYTGFVQFSKHVDLEHSIERPRNITEVCTDFFAGTDAKNPGHDQHGDQVRSTKAS